MKKAVLILILSAFFTETTSAQFTRLHCHYKGWATSIDQAYANGYDLNCELQEYSACGGVNIFRPQIVIAVIDPITCEPWGTPGIDPVIDTVINQSNQFGQLNSNGSCGTPRSQKLFFWDQLSPSSMTALTNFIENVVPDSAYILAYSWLVSPNNIYGYPTTGTFAPWQSDILSTFQNLGFIGLNTIPLDHPWIFFTKKGDLSSVQPLIGTHPQDTLDFYTLICNTSFFSSAGTSICPGGATTLSGPTGLYGYNWSTGDTTQTILVNDTGYYSLTGITNAMFNYSDSSYSYCYYTDSIYVSLASCTGIEEMENTFSVYPNPAKDKISITFTKAFSKAEQLNVYTVYGALKESYLIPANKNSVEIPVDGFGPGVYFISIGSGERLSASRKVVVF